MLHVQFVEPGELRTLVRSEFRVELQIPFTVELATEIYA